MAAVPELSRQCVIWFGEPVRSERDALAAAGWQVRVAPLAGRDGIGLRGGDTVVGLVDLRNASAASLASVDRIVAEHTHLSLLAIVPAQAEDTSPVRRLLQLCVRTFASPLDLDQVIHTLGMLDGSVRPAPPGSIETLVGNSAAMRATHACIHKYAPIDLPVLITGETGTGKEVAARALHELSPRRHRNFAALNCGALPINLVQSELFGHERGSFTGATARRAGLFESADGGTVFLDEIGDLPLDAQTNLLRVLQEGSLERVGSNHTLRVNVRVVAATHLDLERAVQAGRFRSDLYYRLNVLRLHMPRLDERGGDIELLARHFLEQFRAQHSTRARTFGADARRAMREFSWPGHVRELLNRVQRAAVTAESETISANDLGLDGAVRLVAGNGALDSARDAAEQEAILSCLRDSGYNISEAARRLKVSRVTVYRLCRKHRLSLDKLR